MTIREIKREAKILVRENANKSVLAVWCLYIGPALISLIILNSITLMFQQSGYYVNLEFLIPLIMSFFSIWYARYAINIIREKDEVLASIPSGNSYWEYFPYVAFLSVIWLLNYSVSPIIAQYIYIIIFILELIFAPIPYVIAILNRENSGRIGLKLGIKYFFRTIALQIRFIPLYFLIIVTFGLVGIFKYTYIQTTFAIYTLDLMRRENV